MHPVICHLGPFTIYSYGLMFAIAILTSSYLASREAAKAGISAETIYDLTFWVVITGVIGARILYVLLNWDYFVSVPQDIIMLQKGGLAWQGGLVCGGAIGLYYLMKKKLPFWKLLDLIAPFIALGHAIGRIGCFLNGCCYGKAASWGLYYPVWHERMQPTQIYMVLGQLAIFTVLRYYQPKARRVGQVFVLYLVLSSIERFLIEFVRADHALYWGLSISQFVCLAIFVAALSVNYGLGEKK
jgi:phosphatidylglycerol:prolipoprotein diacylglycerol transferase